MNPEPQGGPARRMLRLADDRRLDRVGRDQAQAELAEAGFTEAGAALQALDQLLGSAAADLPAGPLLAGAAAAADPTRALINAARLATTAERPACPVDLGELARFLGASQHMAELILSRPERLADLGRPFNLREAEQRYAQAAALDERAAALRRLLARDTLAIAWADLIGGADVELVTRLLSALADIAVGAAARGLGSDRHFAVIALGKLGGFELNYSSDIDLIFVRPDSVTDQASADRAAGALVRLVGQQTADGHLYRVDMRLRPEGASGQLTRTLSSCLAYYRSVGRPWERQMLTKARVLADCGDAGAGFVAGTREWILGCGLDAGAIRQFKRLKAATEERHGGPEARADIKHAPGGIRDIETIAQFLALLHARVHPAAVTPSTLLTLEKLRVAGAIGTLEAARLRDAYRFFRRVENLLQVLHRVQTHRLPADRRPLARLLGLRDVEAFDDALTEHRQRVRALFERHYALDPEQ